MRALGSSAGIGLYWLTVIASGVLRRVSFGTFVARMWTPLTTQKGPNGSRYFNVTERNDMKTKAALFAALFAVAAAPAFAQGDAAAGEKVFNKCKACHMVGDGAKNRVGPQLNAVVGVEMIVASRIAFFLR